VRGAQGAVYALIAASILVASGCQCCLLRSKEATPKAQVSLSDKEMISIFERINMAEAKVLAIRPSPVDGLWEVGVENKGQRFVIYVDSSKKYVTPGPFIDSVDQRNITRDRIDELEGERRIDVSRLSLDEALVVGKADAPIKVVVFTDPG